MGYFLRSLHKCKELHTGLPHGTVAHGVVPTELHRAVYTQRPRRRSRWNAQLTWARWRYRWEVFIIHSPTQIHGSSHPDRRLSGLQSAGSATIRHTLAKTANTRPKQYQIWQPFLCRENAGRWVTQQRCAQLFPERKIILKQDTEILCSLIIF